MKIAVPVSEPGRTPRRARTDTAGKFVKAGITIAVERDAGRSAGFLDEAYAAAGATIAADEAATVADADIVVRVNKPATPNSTPQARRDPHRFSRAAR